MVVRIRMSYGWLEVAAPFSYMAVTCPPEPSFSLISDQKHWMKHQVIRDLLTIFAFQRAKITTSHTSTWYNQATASKVTKDPQPSPKLDSSGVNGANKGLYKVAAASKELV